MQKGNKPKLAACTPDDIFRALKKLGGFEIKFESAKHTKVLHVATGHAFTIPRHSPVNRHIVKDLVSDFLVEKAGFTEDKVYKHLWC
jgi:hypothetical protein